MARLQPALAGRIESPIVDLELKGIVIIAGNYGSGKTEVAVNLAVDQRRKGHQVRIADLDLVNPY
jgi:Mrp family chromosome partitioning ATPase